MKKIHFIFFLLPLSLLGQELDCCKSKKDIETHLNGIWKMKDSDSGFCYEYQFSEDGLGEFIVFKLKKDGSLKQINEKQPVLKILSTKKGFEIEHDFVAFKTYSGIKHLDSVKLVVKGNDGGETEYYRVLENSCNQSTPNK